MAARIDNRDEVRATHAVAMGRFAELQPLASRVQRVVRAEALMGHSQPEAASPQIMAATRPMTRGIHQVASPRPV